MKKYTVTDFGVEPGKEELQTEALQAVLDLCRETGDKVVLPAGRYRTGGLRMWSDTTLYLEAGAVLVGSDRCEDYAVFPVPEGVTLHTDMEMIAAYYHDRPWATYRRALLSAYGGKNIAVIGEKGSCIDGDDCADPEGEEGYRGPHGLFFTNVQGVTLCGYTIGNCGNFMHQIDTCQHVTMKNVTCFGGSDGVHLHLCENILIEDCVFRTGDDCIAGINMSHLTVRRCELNTSCQAFRVGGSHILIEDCRIWGPGIWPHRMTVVQNRGTEAVRKKSNTLPRECGRHNTVAVFLHFASTAQPSPVPFHDVVFRNCTVENVTFFMIYRADGEDVLENGTHLTELTLDNLTVTGLENPSLVEASPDEPLTVTLRNVRVTMADGTKGGLFDGKDPNTVICK